MYRNGSIQLDIVKEEEEKAIANAFDNCGCYECVDNVVYDLANDGCDCSQNTRTIIQEKKQKAT